MKTYARIQDGLVAELLATEQDITSMFNPALTWIDVSSRADIGSGWRFDGTDFTPPIPSTPPTPPPPIIAELRAQIAMLSAQLAALSDRS